MKKLNKLVIITMVMVLMIVNSIPILAKVNKTKLNRSNITLTVGDSFKLRVVGGDKNIKWKSSKKNIASVTKKGNVKARKKGKARITAGYKNNKYTCDVKVVNKTAEKDVQNASELGTVTEPTLKAEPTPITEPTLAPTPTKSAEIKDPISTPSTTPKVSADAWLLFSVDQTELTTADKAITGKISFNYKDTIIEVTLGEQSLGKTDIIEYGKREFSVNVDLSKCRSGDKIMVTRKYVGEKTGVAVWNQSKTITIN